MAKTVLLVSTDLLAQSRVAAAAEVAGWSYATAHPKLAQTALEGDLLIYDLDAIETSGRFRNAATADPAQTPAKPTRIVGFFSHIDKRKKAAADRLGIEAIPRGAFWRKLPEFLEPSD